MLWLECLSTDTLEHNLCRLLIIDHVVILVNAGLLLTCLTVYCVRYLLTEEFHIRSLT